MSLESGRVLLNVGGTKFETTLQTIEKHPQALLARVFSTANSSLMRKDADGYVFFDRNADLFQKVLLFYRTGIVQQYSSEVKQSIFLEELSFWGFDLLAIEQEAVKSNQIEKSRRFNIESKELKSFLIDEDTDFPSFFLGDLSGDNAYDFLQCLFNVGSGNDGVILLRSDELFLHGVNRERTATFVCSCARVLFDSFVLSAGESFSVQFGHECFDQFALRDEVKSLLNNDNRMPVFVRICVEKPAIYLAIVSKTEIGDVASLSNFFRSSATTAAVDLVFNASLVFKFETDRLRSIIGQAAQSLRTRTCFTIQTEEKLVYIGWQIQDMICCRHFFDTKQFEFPDSDVCFAFSACKLNAWLNGLPHNVGTVELYCDFSTTRVLFRAHFSATSWLSFSCAMLHCN